MTFTKFRDTWRGTRLENQWQRWLLLGLLGANILLAFVALGRGAIVSVTVPPGFSAAATVSRQSGDVDYQQAWALFLATLLGNVTPGNADVAKKAIEPVLAPAIYRDTMRVLNEQIEAIKRDRVAMRFEPRQVKFETDTGKVFVEGFSVVSGAAGKEDRNPRTYEFLLKIQNYRLVIEHMDNYIGSARTTAELERLDRAAENQERIEARRQAASGEPTAAEMKSEGAP